MDNKQFEKKIRNCRRLFDEYSTLLRELEDEYEKRYGHTPSDVSDEWWIDTMHYGQGSINFKEMLQEAERMAERKLLKENTPDEK